MKQRNDVQINWYENVSKTCASIALIVPVAYATPLTETSGVFAPVIISFIYVVFSAFAHIKASSLCLE